MRHSLLPIRGHLTAKAPEIVDIVDHRVADVRSVVAWIGAEMEFALSQAVASGGAFEHRPSECGYCVQDFLSELDLRDLLEKPRDWSLGPMTLFQRPICVSIRLRWGHPVTCGAAHSTHCEPPH